MAGTSESTVIRTKLLVKSAFCTSLALLKFSTIFKLEALASGLFENRMHFVLSGCSASKMVYHFFKLPVYLLNRSSRFWPDKNKVV